VLRYALLILHSQLLDVSGQIRSDGLWQFQIRDIDELDSQDSKGLLDLSQVKIEVPPSDLIVHDDGDLPFDLFIGIILVLWSVLPLSQLLDLINESLHFQVLWVLVTKRGFEVEREANWSMI